MPDGRYSYALVKQMPRIKKSDPAYEREEGEIVEEGEMHEDIPEGKFRPLWLKSKYADAWVIKCPICKAVSGTAISQFVHKFDCPNKNKLPILSGKPSSGGRKTHKRKSKKRTTRRR